jgi:hypothetical protein
MVQNLAVLTQNQSVVVVVVRNHGVLAQNQEEVVAVR